MCIVFVSKTLKRKLKQDFSNMLQCQIFILKISKFNRELKTQFMLYVISKTENVKFWHVVFYKAFLEGVVQVWDLWKFCHRECCFCVVLFANKSSSSFQLAHLWLFQGWCLGWFSSLVDDTLLPAVVRSSVRRTPSLERKYW